MPIVFPGFRTKALTFSYDDGTLQDRRLAALFRKYGLKATFNLNSGAFDEVQHGSHGGFSVNFSRVHAGEVRDLYASFEVASHTLTHPILTDIPDEEIRRQVREDIAAISRLTKKPVTGFAYPCGAYNEHVLDLLQEMGIRYARTVEDHHTFALPENFLAWHPTCHDHDEAAMPLADTFVNSTDEELRLFYIWGHSFELDKDDMDRWQAMEKLCAFLAEREDIWYATNGEICEYVTAMRSVTPKNGQLFNTSSQPLYIRRNGADVLLQPGDRIEL